MTTLSVNRGEPQNIMQKVNMNKTYMTKDKQA